MRVDRHPMKQRGIVLVAAFSTLAFACRSLSLFPATPTPQILPTPTLASALAHFENKWVAFDYPAGWALFEAGFENPIWYPTVDFGASLVAGLGDDRFFGFGSYYRSIRVLRRDLPATADLNGIMAAVYAQSGAKYPWPLVAGGLDLDGAITIGRQAVVQRSYRIYSGEPAYDLCDIWIPGDTDLYIVNIATEWTNPEDVAAFEATAADLLASLVIK